MFTKKHELDIVAMIGCYEESKSIITVGDTFGVSVTTAKRRLAAAGVKFYGRKLIDPARHVKRCYACRRTKKIDEFNRCKSRTDGRSATCKECWSEYVAKRTLASKYGLSVDDFDTMLQKQGGGCAICGHAVGILHRGKRLRLCVDHCHQTGVVRGILCNGCNTGIGSLKDDPNLLERAAEYLRTQGDS